MTDAPMKRLPDWRQRLAAEIERQRRAPFAWGAHDCAIGLAAGVAEALTGHDFRAGWPRYRSQSGALRALRARGFTSLGEAVAAHFPEIPPAFASVGDLSVIATDGPIGEALCVVDASGLIVLTDEGHGLRPRSDLLRAFKIG